MLLILHWEVFEADERGVPGFAGGQCVLGCPEPEMNVHSQIPQTSNNSHSGLYSGALVVGLLPQIQRLSVALRKVQRRPSQDWVAQS